MADRKLGPATRGSNTPMGTAHVVDPATLAQFLALLAILTRTVAKVRLFEDTDGDRTQRSETALSGTRDLHRFAQWLLVAPASAGEETLLVSSRHGLGRHYASPPRRDPDQFLGALQRLMQPAAAGALPLQSTGEPSGVPTDDSERRFDPYANRDAIPAWLFEEPARQPDTTLDFVFHRPSETWRVELSPGPELRGESIAELRRKAPPFPDPRETPPYDLPQDAYFTVPAAAKHLGVDRSTVTRRVVCNKLIGFAVFKRALRIPKDQFLGRDVLPGIPEALALFRQGVPASPGRVDHKSAWAFLGGDLYLGDPEPRPIDRLRSAAVEGTTKAVLADLARVKESLDHGDHL